MKKLIFVFATLFVFYSQVTASTTIDREFSEAETLFYQRKYNFAREAFLHYLGRRPLSTNDTLYYYIGATYFQDKQYSNAIYYYKIAFDLNDNYRYGNGIANSYYQLEDYKDAIIWYRRAIDRLYSPYIPIINRDIEEYEVINKNIVTNIVYIGTNDLYTFLDDEYLEGVKSVDNKDDSTNTLSDTIPTNVLDTSSIQSNDTNGILDTTSTNISSVQSNNTNTLDSSVVLDTTSTNILNTDIMLNANTNALDADSMIDYEALEKKEKEIEKRNTTLAINTHISKMFFEGEFFTNVVITNMYTNTAIFTNVKVSFETNNNIFLIPYNDNIADDESTNQVTSLDNTNTTDNNTNTVTQVDTNTVTQVDTNTVTQVDTNTVTQVDTNTNSVLNNIFILVNVTNEVVNNESLTVTNDIITFDPYTTKASYYNAYLHLGHTLLRMKDYTNAALNYEIFLTNVGDGYYQKDALEKVINTIRNPKQELNFVAFTNGYRVFTNSDQSIITDRLDVKGNMHKKTIFITDDETSYQEYGNEVYEYLYKTSYGVIVKTTTYPSGKNIIEVEYSNGDIKRDTFYEDGSKSILIKMYDGDVYEYIENKDASFIKRNSIKSDDEDETISLIKSDGSVTRNTKTKDFISYYNRSVDGGSINRVEFFNGEILKESFMPDGTIINQKLMGDGSSTISVSYKDGSIANTKTDTNGVSTTLIHLPDGSTQTRVSKDFVGVSFTYKTVLDDGGTMTKTVLDDGTITIEKQSKDGTYMVETILADGGVESETREKDGSVKSSILYIDGSTKSVVKSPDGTLITEISNADESYSISTDYSNGSSEYFTRDANSVETRETRDDLGNYIKSINYEDGRISTSTKKANGVIINIEMSKEETTTEAIRPDGANIIIKEAVGADKVIMIYDNTGSPMTRDNATLLIEEILGDEYNINADMVENILIIQDPIESVESVESEESDISNDNSTNTDDATTLDE